MIRLARRQRAGWPLATAAVPDRIGDVHATDAESEGAPDTDSTVGSGHRARDVTLEGPRGQCSIVESAPDKQAYKVRTETSEQTRAPTFVDGVS